MFMFMSNIALSPTKLQDKGVSKKFGVNGLFLGNHTIKAGSNTTIPFNKAPLQYGMNFKY